MGREERERAVVAVANPNPNRFDSPRLGLRYLYALAVVTRLRGEIASQDLTRWVGPLTESFENISVLEMSLPLTFDLAIAPGKEPL